MLPVNTTKANILSPYDVVTEDNNIFEDAPTYLPQAFLGVPEQFDPTWRAHRTAKITTPRIEWTIPKSKPKEGEQVQEEPKEVTSVHNIVGLRCIIVQWKFGAGLSEGEGTDFKTICQSTRMEEIKPDGAIHVVNDRLPLSFPYGQIFQSKGKEPHKVTKVLRDSPITMFGSRPPVGKTKEEANGEVRSCTDCVLAGEHYIGSVGAFMAGEKGIPTCSMAGEVLVVVYMIGMKDISEYEEDVMNNRIKVKWVSIRDAKFKTMVDGQLTQLDKPFALRIGGLTKTQMSAIGKGQFDRNVIRAHEDRECFLPDNIMSTGEYFNYLHDKSQAGKRFRTLKGGALAYTQVTDIYTGKLRAKQYGSEAIPVFSPVDDPEIIEAGSGWTINDWVKTALTVVQTERAAVMGKTVEETRTKIAGTTTQAPQLKASGASTERIASAAVDNNDEGEEPTGAVASIPTPNSEPPAGVELEYEAEVPKTRDNPFSAFKTAK